MDGGRDPARVSGLLRFITCGSVDDGKSTLIGRLLYDSKGLLADQITALEAASKKRGASEVDLSLLTDGLVAEREQGITIDVAYRYFSTPARKFIIGDSPGHAQYTRNMVTAASTADVAVLLVDAETGIQPQTRRHAYLARWLGIGRVVLAVNKMDRVDASAARFEAIRDAFAALVGGLGFAEVQALPLSALHGDNVVAPSAAMPWYRGPTLLAWLETAPSRHDDARAGASAPLRFPVQRVSRATGRNAQDSWRGGEIRGYQGTIAAGRLGIGDVVVVAPGGQQAVVTRILTADGALAGAAADHAVTVCLDRELDISRGDVLVAADAPPRVGNAFDAEICWFDAVALDPARVYLVKLGAQLVRAKIAAIDARIDVETLAPAAATPATSATLAMNDIAHVRIRTQKPVAFDAYRASRATGAFVLIDESSNRTVAAGTIG